MIWLREPPTGCTELPSMDRKEFTRVVREVLQSLPEEFAAHLTHAEVVIDDEPTPAQIRGVGLDPRHDTLFGLY